MGFLDALTKAAIPPPTPQTVRSMTAPTSSGSRAAPHYWSSAWKRNYTWAAGYLGAIATSVFRTLRLRRADAASRATPRRSRRLGAVLEEPRYRIASTSSLSIVPGDPIVIPGCRVIARYSSPDRKPDRTAHSRIGTISLTRLRGFAGMFAGSKESGNCLFDTALNLRSLVRGKTSRSSRGDYAWRDSNAFRQWTSRRSAFASVRIAAGSSSTTRRRRTAAAAELLEARCELLVGGCMVDPATVGVEDRLARGGRVSDLGHGPSFNATPTAQALPLLGESLCWTYHDGCRVSGLHEHPRQAGLRTCDLGSLLLRYSKEYLITSTRSPTRPPIISPIGAGLLGSGQHRWSSAQAVCLPPDLARSVARSRSSRGDYANFKEFVAPLTVEKRSFDLPAHVRRDPKPNDRRVPFFTLTGIRCAVFRFLIPFNFRSLRVNAVLSGVSPDLDGLRVGPERESEDPMGEFQFRATDRPVDAKPEMYFS